MERAQPVRVLQQDIAFDLADPCYCIRSLDANELR